MPFNVQGDSRIKDKNSLKADTVLQNLKPKTPAELDDYIETNVTDLASAKDVLKIMAKVMVYTLRQLD